jgi:hypothetical protein
MAFSLPSDLYQRCRKLFSVCHEFETTAALHSLFIVQELASYRDRLPEARNIQERVDFLIVYLLSKRQNNSWVFVTFIEILSRNQPPGSQLREDLEVLAKDVKLELDRQNNLTANEQPVQPAPNINTQQTSSILGKLAPEQRSQLLSYLNERFSLSELQTVAFDIGIDSDELPHQTKGDFSRSLVEHCERAQNIDKLMEVALKKRSSVEIAEILKTSQKANATTNPVSPASSVKAENTTSAKRELKVFLCHAYEDKPKVRQLYQDLKKAGFKPWLDEEDLVQGENWRVAIPNAIYSADACIICLSKISVFKEGYLQKEIKIALDAAEEKPENTIFIIPTKLDEVNVPIQLEHIKEVNLYDERGLERLIKALRFRAKQCGIA